MYCEDSESSDDDFDDADDGGGGADYADDADDSDYDDDGDGDDDVDDSASGSSSSSDEGDLVADYSGNADPSRYCDRWGYSGHTNQLPYASRTKTAPAVRLDTLAFV